MGEPKEDLLTRLAEILGNDRQKDVARKIGVTQPTVNRWLSGTLPDALSLSRICRALGVNANWLLGVDELAPPIAQEWVALHGDVGAGPAGTDRRLNDGYSFKREWAHKVSDGDPSRLVAVKLTKKDRRGESMAPTIRPGASLVVLRGDSEIVDGAIYLVNPKGAKSPEDWTVKRAWLAGDGRYLVLKGDNPTTPAMVEDLETRALEKVVIGRVVYVGQEEA